MCIKSEGWDVQTVNLILQPLKILAPYFILIALAHCSLMLFIAGGLKDEAISVLFLKEGQSKS